MSRTNFHGPKGVRVTEVQLYISLIVFDMCKAESEDDVKVLSIGADMPVQEQKRWPILAV